MAIKPIIVLRESLIVLMLVIAFLDAMMPMIPASVAVSIIALLGVLRIIFQLMKDNFGEGEVKLPTRLLVIFRESTIILMIFIAALEIMQPMIPVDYAATVIAILAFMRILMQFLKDQLKETEPTPDEPVE